MRKLRALADRGSRLQAEGLAFQALQQRGAQLRAGVAQAYVKLRAVSASLPHAVEA